MTGSVASGEKFSWLRRVFASIGGVALIRTARGSNELKGRNIRVNVLSPGRIATPMQDQSHRGGERMSNP